MDHEEYLKRVKSYIKTPTPDMERQLGEFTNMCSYISGQYDQDESFEVLKKHLQELESGREETNRVFYMALPPSVFVPVSQRIKRVCYPKKGIARVIVGCGMTISMDELTLRLIGREAVRKGSCKCSSASESAGSGLVRG